jgi:hypothetical protein
LVTAVACSDTGTTVSGGGSTTLANPDSLTYQLTTAPAGVLLSWTQQPPDSNVSAYAIYGRDSSATNSPWFEIGITVSTSYHLTPPLDSEYYVTSQDVYGNQSTGTPTLKINLADSVQTPGNVRGTPYNAAVTVAWDSIAQAGYNAARFQYYNLYSMPTTGSSSCDTTTLSLEGATISNAFVITGLANDVTRCYTVTSVSLSGEESPLASPFVALTPSAGDPAFAAGRVRPGTPIVAEHRRARHWAKK